MKNIKQIIKKSQSNTLAFSTRKHPVFGRGGAYSEANPPDGVTRSPFYWWFKFLQLSDDYKNAVAGKKTKISRDIVKDFGNVSKIDFKSWWQKRAHLFAEPPQNYKMIVAQNINEIAPFNNEKVINLVVPLDWTNVGIKRSFARVIDQLVPKQAKGKRAKDKTIKSQIIKTEAQYKIGRKWSITGFEYAYKVYLAKQAANVRLAKGEKKTAWADIGIQAKLPLYERYITGKTIYTEEDVRRILTIHAKRHFGRAEAYIKAAGTKQFP
ncbi:hypothetical protein LZG75_12095 [Polynucleobacter sp. IMCC30063]|uniref:hypothetical protein n=1 Tax=Polynucleobacter sp. IMCC30063 TaxID=2907298 RepID=UPI001F1E177E|nr:hypothetical protein [Polynucleobacter sp. IMCC30063]MCE7506970.1 hypothetical protein [Polynucleobacter sp. IMCC30063]